MLEVKKESISKISTEPMPFKPLLSNHKDKMLTHEKLSLNPHFFQVFSIQASIVFFCLTWSLLKQEKCCHFNFNFNFSWKLRQLQCQLFHTTPTHPLIQPQNQRIQLFRTSSASISTSTNFKTNLNLTKNPQKYDFLGLDQGRKSQHNGNYRYT